MNSSKRNIVIIVALAVFIAAGAYFLLQSNSGSERLEPFFQQEVVSNEELSFGFTYESGDEGLALFEPEVSGEPLKAAYILMLTPDFIQVRNNNADDTPPTISMFVFTKPSQPEDSQLSRSDEIKQWAEQNQELTSYANLNGEPEEVEIDGVKALMYETTGPYNQDVYLASYRKNIYMFVGQYDSKSDPIYSKFQDVLNRVTFQ